MEQRERLPMSRLTQGSGFIQRAGLAVERNIYGIRDPQTGADIPYTLDIGISQADNDVPRADWKWSVPQGHGGVCIFPELIWGKKPWLDFSTSYLPTPMAKVPNLQIEYVTQTRCRGEANGVFEAWLCHPPKEQTEWEGLPADETNISHEVMIWTGSQGAIQPAGRCIEQNVNPIYGIDETCDLWQGEGQEGDHKWTILSLVYQRPRQSGRLLLGNALSWLAGRKFMPFDRTLASVEFGNEVWQGEGETSVDRFVVTP